MKPIQTLLVVLLLVLGNASAQATQKVVTFEDTASSGLPDTYAGISVWEQLGFVTDVLVKFFRTPR
jgi:hypothetical protein